MKKWGLKFFKFLAAIVLFIPFGMRGQDMLGVVFSNYTAISTATINPALLTGTRVFMDVNIVGGVSSIANNMFYFQPDNNTISKAVSMDTSLFSGGRFAWGRSYNYYDNTQDKYFTTVAKLMGPSLMVQAGKHAFGFSTAARTVQGGKNIPYGIPITMYEGLSYPEFHGVEFENINSDFVSLTWGEIGLSYAYDFYDLYSNRLTFGLTAKALFGLEGGYISMQNTSYIIENDRDVNFTNIDADIGYSLPVTYDTTMERNFDPMIKGYGAGFDFGLVFTKLKSTIVYEGRGDKLCAKPYNDYVYKIGFSILDVGAITFTENAALHNFDNVSKNWVEFDTIQFRGIEDAVQIYSRGFYGNDEESYVGDKVQVWLPATISLQFEYHLKQRIYLSALWMHPLKLNSRTVWRPSQISFIPRWENRMFGVSVPISLFNYSDPRLGLAVRFYTFTIGTDRLGSLFGVSNFNGMDIYFSFRFNIGKGSCASYNRGACSNSDFGTDW